MPIMEFSERGLLRGKVVVPGWYRVYIESVSEEPAKIKEGKSPSTNFPVEGTIKFNGDTGDTEFANVPIEWNFNSKFESAMADFLRTFGVDVKSKTRYDLKSAEGREVDMYIDNRTWEGRILNNVTHKYRTIKEEVKAVA